MKQIADLLNKNEKIESKLWSQYLSTSYVGIPIEYRSLYVGHVEEPNLDISIITCKQKTSVLICMRWSIGLREKQQRIKERNIVIRRQNAEKKQLLKKRDPKNVRMYMFYVYVFVYILYIISYLFFYYAYDYIRIIIHCYSLF
eukprot:GHVR01032488.1.p1 GENE.GHVR01032488.1~~GHVR01032488.1.p1  ORF type:complete len:143 (+),score=3.30 GHVR01032488.1:594-1022(+)